MTFVSEAERQSWRISIRGGGWGTGGWLEWSNIGGEVVFIFNHHHHQDCQDHQDHHSPAGDPPIQAWQQPDALAEESKCFCHLVMIIMIMILTMVKITLMELMTATMMMMIKHPQYLFRALHQWFCHTVNLHFHFGNHDIQTNQEIAMISFLWVNKTLYSLETSKVDFLTLIILHIPGAISLWMTSVSATYRDLSPVTSRTSHLDL